MDIISAENARLLNKQYDGEKDARETKKKMANCWNERIKSAAYKYNKTEVDLPVSSEDLKVMKLTTSDILDALRSQGYKADYIENLKTKNNVRVGYFLISWRG